MIHVVGHPAPRCCCLMVQQCRLKGPIVGHFSKKGQALKRHLPFEIGQPELGHLFVGELLPQASAVHVPTTVSFKSFGLGNPTNIVLKDDVLGSVVHAVIVDPGELVSRHNGMLSNNR